QDSLAHRSLHVGEQRRVAPGAPHNRAAEEQTEEEAPPGSIPHLLIEAPLRIRLPRMSQRLQGAAGVYERQHPAAEAPQITLEAAAVNDPGLDQLRMRIPEGPRLR